MIDVSGIRKTRMFRWALAVGVLVLALAGADGSPLGPAARAENAPAISQPAQQGAEARAAAKFVTAPTSPLNFEIYVGGLLAATLQIDSRRARERYEVSADLRTAGLVKSFYKASIEARSEGRATGEELEPSRFVSLSRNPKLDRDIEIRYSAGRPELTVTPDYEAEPWDVGPEQVVGKPDPLTSLSQLLVPGPISELCGRGFEIYDARRLYALYLGKAEVKNEGEEVLCPSIYSRLGGFPPEMLGAEADVPVDIFFARRVDGSYEFLKAMLDTSFGTAVLRRAR